MVEAPRTGESTEALAAQGVEVGPAVVVLVVRAETFRALGQPVPGAPEEALPEPHRLKEWVDLDSDLPQDSLEVGEETASEAEVEAAPAALLSVVGEVAAPM